MGVFARYRRSVLPLPVDSPAVYSKAVLPLIPALGLLASDSHRYYSPTQLSNTYLAALLKHLSYLY